MRSAHARTVRVSRAAENYWPGPPTQPTADGMISEWVNVTASPLLFCLPYGDPAWSDSNRSFPVPAGATVVVPKNPPTRLN